MRPFLYRAGDAYHLFYERYPAFRLPLTVMPGLGWRSWIEHRWSPDLAHWSRPTVVLRPSLGWHRTQGLGAAVGNPTVLRTARGFALYYSAALVRVPDCGFRTSRCTSAWRTPNRSPARTGRSRARCCRPHATIRAPTSAPAPCGCSASTTGSSACRTASGSIPHGCEPLGDLRPLLDRRPRVALRRARRADRRPDDGLARALRLRRRRPPRPERPLVPLLQRSRPGRDAGGTGSDRLRGRRRVAPLGNRKCRRNRSRGSVRVGATGRYPRPC